MRRHKTVALVILILSIVNFALAAPALRETHEARDDAIVRGLEDVAAVAAKKRGIVFGRPLPIEEPEGVSEVESDDEGYSTAPDEPSDRPPTSTEPPSRVSTRPKIMTPEKIKATKIVTVAGLFTAVILGLVDINASFKNASAS